MTSHSGVTTNAVDNYRTSCRQTVQSSDFLSLQKYRLWLVVASTIRFTQMHSSCSVPPEMSKHNITLANASGLLVAAISFTRLPSPSTRSSSATVPHTVTVAITLRFTRNCCGIAPRQNAMASTTHDFPAPLRPKKLSLHPQSALQSFRPHTAPSNRHAPYKRLAADIDHVLADIVFEVAVCRHVSPYRTPCSPARQAQYNTKSLTR
jgi:hypothetical protein